MRRVLRTTTKMSLFQLSRRALVLRLLRRAVLPLLLVRLLLVPLLKEPLAGPTLGKVPLFRLALLHLRLLHLPRRALRRFLLLPARFQRHLQRRLPQADLQQCRKV
jgi:hypothetical protein